MKTNSTEPILIVAATDNHYAILLAALIKSIEVNHHTHEQLSFLIIDDNVSSKNKKKIESAITNYKSILRWFSSKEIIPPDIKMPLDSSSLPDTALLRLFAPYIIPPESKKVLYLDVDMIVQTDISKLWNTELEDHIVAAVQDRTNTASSSWITMPNYAELGISGESKYFNSGLLLINAQKWREEKIAARVIECIQRNLKFASLPDQYGLNVVLNNQWMELDSLWNTFSDVEAENPHLIHYVMSKPIFKSYIGLPEYQKIFFYYLNLTEWKHFRLLGTRHLILKKIRTRFVKLNRQLANLHIMLSR